MTKTILITGASSGIGAGMAREFAQKGYNLAICARRLERLETLKQELEQQYGIRVIAKSLDVTNYDQVFQVFREFKQNFGQLDRIIVNAGVGEGRRIGKGNFAINKATVETNFISALAQCEAAVEIFREQNSGHLVMISSMSAIRGMPKHLTAYGASKAAVAHLAEGIRAELIDTPIQVTTIFPGYIRTEINEGAKKLPFEVDEKTGSRLLAAEIEKAPIKAYVPKWPWLPLGFAMKVLPLKLVNKLG
ncbi:short-chain dehydrogenase [Acinetobacter sp. KAM398]|uniref:SDR family oxidoreductase n=1 Tax=unclassified Acinetobacter TaxID=196816 RepID=UPI001F38F070|nr:MULTISPECIES: SDR family oxidoreductase [unclassified Acinetobacter]GJC32595.1 short-chain dehydrogenase [Acinetobacter sp. KAM392]GJC35415.1 short-chain dehydrogenase [Acinetobacter sp. KAM393]GJC38224.1 short-chain dehydrogenase [Acinetobacter sp. KAM394]GJC41049.1 short-chain dehydrogenase [Acinetobacter sp. KAM395]GJC43865.1 short-chain dehydrogenase [Acinetobacter sp. KAM396]